MGNLVPAMARSMDSIVIWTLHPKEGGTQPFLEHSGFKETADLALYPIMNEGWLKNIQKIATPINTVKHGSTNT